MVTPSTPTGLPHLPSAEIRVRSGGPPWNLGSPLPRSRGFLGRMYLRRNPFWRSHGPADQVRLSLLRVYAG